MGEGGGIRIQPNEERGITRDEHGENDREIHLRGVCLCLHCPNKSRVLFMCTCMCLRLIHPHISTWGILCILHLGTSLREPCVCICGTVHIVVFNFSRPKATEAWEQATLEYVKTQKELCKTILKKKRGYIWVSTEFSLINTFLELSALRRRSTPSEWWPKKKEILFWMIPRLLLGKYEWRYRWQDVGERWIELPASKASESDLKTENRKQRHSRRSTERGE